MARILSAIQPSGTLTIGNYLGALKMLKLQDEHECLFSFVDQHAITVLQDRLELRKKIKELTGIIFSLWIRSRKSNDFRSVRHLLLYTQLAWMLTCNTSMGELDRMTQFKDKSQK